ncbi:MAG: MoaD/ThiS family protein [Pseudomonadales bacterium]
MHKVSLSGVLRAAANDQAEVQLAATTIRELLTSLVAQYPAMQKHIDEEGIAVSINGEIYRDEWSTPIPPNAEVFLLPRIPGG